VTRLKGISIIDAAKEPDGIYGLNLFKSNKSQKPDELKAAAWQREQDNNLYTAFEVWELNTFKTLCAYRHRLVADKADYAPKTIGDDFHPYYVEACHRLDYIEHLLDFFMDATFIEKLNFFKTQRDEVTVIADALKARDRSRTQTA